MFRTVFQIERTHLVNYSLRQHADNYRTKCRTVKECMDIYDQDGILGSVLSKRGDRVHGNMDAFLRERMNKRNPRQVLKDDSAPPSLYDAHPK